MNANQISNARLPLRGNLAPLYALSMVIATLMTVAALAGLLYQNAIYPSDDLLTSFLPTDVSFLFIGLPMLLGSMWLTRRGNLLGLLSWPGALFFTLYNYLVYVFAMPLNVAFLLHLTLVMLSVYVLIALLASIHPPAVQAELSGAVPERLAGGILTGLGLLFFLRAIGVLANGLIHQSTISEIEFAVNRSDYLIAPAWMIGGLLLWRCKPYGYVVGLGLLFQASMLFIGLIIFLLLQPVFANVPFARVDVALVFTMGLICFIPFTLFVRGVVSARSS